MEEAFCLYNRMEVLEIVSNIWTCEVAGVLHIYNRMEGMNDRLVFGGFIMQISLR